MGTTRLSCLHDSCHLNLVSLAITRLTIWFGTSRLCNRAFPVTGDVSCCCSQCSTACLSYVCPSAAITGSTIVTCIAMHCETISAKQWRLLSPHTRYDALLMHFSAGLAAVAGAAVINNAHPSQANTTASSRTTLCAQQDRYVNVCCRFLQNTIQCIHQQEQHRLAIAGSCDNPCMLPANQLDTPLK